MIDVDFGRPDGHRHTLAHSRRTPPRLARPDLLGEITRSQSVALGAIAVATTAAIVFGALNLMGQLIDQFRPWL